MQQVTQLGRYSQLLLSLFVPLAGSIVDVFIVRDSRISGREWDVPTSLPWIGTPATSVHSRMHEPAFRQHGVTRNIITVIDQEPSMRAMVRSGFGLSLCRDSIALNERQARGMVISDTVELTTTLEFVCLKARRQDPVINTANELSSQVRE